MGLFFLTFHGSSHVFTSSKVEGRKLSGRRRRTSFGSLVKRSIFIDEILLHLNREMDAWKCGPKQKKAMANGREMDKMKDNVNARIVSSFVLNSLVLLYMMMSGRWGSRNCRLCDYVCSVLYVFCWFDIFDLCISKICIASLTTKDLLWNLVGFFVVTYHPPALSWNLYHLMAFRVSFTFQHNIFSFDITLPPIIMEEKNGSPPPNSGYLLSTSSCHFHENGGKSSVEGRFCVSHTFSWFAQNPRNVCGSTTPQLSEPCRPGFVVPNFPVSVSIYFFYVKTNPSWHMIHITCSFCSCLVALCVWSVAFLL